MNNRRTFLLTLTAGLVAAVVIITPVIAEEFFGFITNVDVDGKKISVVPAKGDGDGFDIKITDSTEVVTPKGAFDLEKLAKVVTKSKDAGKKGVQAKVIHEGKVASKISIFFGAGKKKEAN